LNLTCSDREEGAFRIGTVNNVIGDSDAGKTLLALSCLAAVCQDRRFRNYRLIYDDVERANTFDMEFLYGESTAKRVGPPARDADDEPIYSVTTQDLLRGILDLTKYPFVKEEMDPFATINS
jgi:hypothetical protein